MSIGRRWVWAVVAAAGLALGACGDDDDDDNGGDAGDGGNGGNGAGTVSATGTFATAVHPILRAKCGTCHGTGVGSATLQTAFDQAKTRVNTTTPAQSPLVVKGNGGDGHAGGDALSDAEATTITAWIQAGASGQ